MRRGRVLRQRHAPPRSRRRPLYSFKLYQTNTTDWQSYLTSIRAQVSEGTNTLKEAIKHAGTFARPSVETDRKAVSQKGKQPAPVGDELPDLAKLEAENRHLRTVLVKKLRSEHTDLRKRFGLA